MSTNSITGRVSVYANGKMLINKAGAKASGIGVNGKPNVERKAVMYDNGIAGYREEIVPARCEVTIIDRADQSLSELVEIFENGTIVFASSVGGKVYTMDNATCLGNLSVTSGDGEVPLVFESISWREGVFTI